MIPNSSVDEHGEIIYYVMLVDTEKVDVQDELKKQTWRNSMLQELSSIEKNKHWEPVSLLVATKLI